MRDPLDEHDDEALFKRIQKGDERAFEILYNRHWKRLFAFIYNRLYVLESSEKLVQEIFLELWNQRKTLTIFPSLPGYLFDVAKYKLLNAIRSGKAGDHYVEDIKHFVTHQQDPAGEENPDKNGTEK